MKKRVVSIRFRLILGAKVIQSEGYNTEDIILLKEFVVSLEQSRYAA